MKSIDSLTLSNNQKKALKVFKKSVLQFGFVKEFFLFGSTVRGEANNESDVDVLVLTFETISRIQRQKLRRAVFEINLKYNTNISILIIDQDNWHHGFAVQLQVYKDITDQGVKF